MFDFRDNEQSNRDEHGFISQWVHALRHHTSATLSSVLSGFNEDKSLAYDNVTVIDESNVDAFVKSIAFSFDWKDINNRFKLDVKPSDLNEYCDKITSTLKRSGKYGQKKAYELYYITTCFLNRMVIGVVNRVREIVADTLINGVAALGKAEQKVIKCANDIKDKFLARVSKKQVTQPIEPTPKPTPRVKPTPSVEKPVKYMTDEQLLTHYKAYLQQLCASYDIAFRQRDTKPQLVKKLSGRVVVGN